MPFYDFHTYTNQNKGENSLEEMIGFAKKLGLSGLGVVRFHTEDIKPLPKDKDIDIVNVVMLKSDNPNELLEIAKKAREKAEILAVYGGNYDINRIVCENSIFDILYHPELNRLDSGLDHVCMRAAQENRVAIEINFREILETYRKVRMRILAAMKKNVMLAKKYGTNVITTSGALSKWGLRPGRDLAAIANLLGLDLGKAIETASYVPEEILRTNREKLAGKRWEGIRTVEEQV